MNANNTLELLQPVLADLADVVDGIREDQINLATPDTEWDVAQLRDHILSWLVVFAEGYADPRGQAPVAKTKNYSSPPNPGQEVRTASTRLADAIRGGAADRPLSLGTDAMPGDMALEMILWEYVMHGWDLARATDQPWRPDPVAAEASLAFAPGILTPSYQGEGMTFGPAVPVAADASALDRLLGISGRDPHWTAPTG